MRPIEAKCVQFKPNAPNSSRLCPIQAECVQYEPKTDKFKPILRPVKAECAQLMPSASGSGCERCGFRHADIFFLVRLPHFKRVALRLADELTGGKAQKHPLTLRQTAAADICLRRHTCGLRGSGK